MPLPSRSLPVVPQTESSSIYSCLLQLNWNRSECPAAGLFVCLFVLQAYLSPSLDYHTVLCLCAGTGPVTANIKSLLNTQPQSNKRTKTCGCEWKSRPGDRGGVKSWLNCLLGQSAEGDTVKVASICNSTDWQKTKKHGTSQWTQWPTKKAAY